jgi:hypothetical protein
MEQKPRVGSVLLSPPNQPDQWIFLWDSFSLDPVSIGIISELNVSKEEASLEIYKIGENAIIEPTRQNKPIPLKELGHRVFIKGMKEKDGYSWSPVVYFIQNVPIPLQQVHSKEEVLLNLGTH